MKYVYFLRGGKDNYKVGIAINVYNRMKSLQTSNSAKIELITCKRVTDAPALENLIHGRLKKYRSGGGREWFKLEPHIAIEVAIYINKAEGVEATDVDALRELLEQQTHKQKQIFGRMDDILARIKYEKATPNAIPKQQIDDSAKVEQKKERTQKRLEEQASEDAKIMDQAKDVFLINGKASTSMLQRKLRIGYGKAARIIELFEEQGYLGEADGSRPRKVLNKLYVEPRSVTLKP